MMGTAMLVNQVGPAVGQGEGTAKVTIRGNVPISTPATTNSYLRLKFTEPRVILSDTNAVTAEEVQGDLRDCEGGMRESAARASRGREMTDGRGRKLIERREKLSRTCT